jgi:hypothetical protein
MKQEAMSQETREIAYVIEANTVCHVRPACDQLFLIYQLTRGLPPVFRNAEVLESTQLLSRNIMLFRDQRNTFFVSGISTEISNMSKFVEWQKRQRELHFPHIRQTYAMGISMGAYAAIANAYFLQVPIVWAFAPPVTRLDVVLEPDDAASRRCSDLATLLRDGNGCTEYRIFFNQQFDGDREAALRLADCPGVRLFPQKGNDHQVISTLYESGGLKDLLIPFEKSTIT